MKINGAFKFKTSALRYHRIILFFDNYMQQDTFLETRIINQSSDKKIKIESKIPLPDARLHDTFGYTELFYPINFIKLSKEYFFLCYDSPLVDENGVVKQFTWRGIFLKIKKLNIEKVGDSFTMPVRLEDNGQTSYAYRTSTSHLVSQNSILFLMLPNSGFNRYTKNGESYQTLRGKLIYFDSNYQFTTSRDIDFNSTRSFVPENVDGGIYNKHLEVLLDDGNILAIRTEIYLVWEWIPEDNITKKYMIVNVLANIYNISTIETEDSFYSDSILLRSFQIGFPEFPGDAFAVGLMDFNIQKKPGQIILIYNFSRLTETMPQDGGTTSTLFIQVIDENANIISGDFVDTFPSSTGNTSKNIQTFLIEDDTQLLILANGGDAPFIDGVTGDYYNIARIYLVDIESMNILDSVFMDNYIVQRHSIVKMGQKNSVLILGNKTEGEYPSVDKIIACNNGVIELSDYSIEPELPEYYATHGMCLIDQPSA
jgi:hypothetical protein